MGAVIVIYLEKKQGLGELKELSSLGPLLVELGQFLFWS